LERTSKTSAGVPSLDEAQRVVSLILDDEARTIASKVVAGTPPADSLREILALTIAVVGVTEQVYRAAGRKHPDQWESLERSARTFMDHHVSTWFAEDDAELQRAITAQRRRRLAAHAGVLCLVESDRNKLARWAAITLPDGTPMPITEEVGEGLVELTSETHRRVHQHLVAEPTNDQATAAGQVVGLLCASECLLALCPSNEVAAFCVQLAVVSAQAT
jgi:hypothetical protein